MSDPLAIEQPADQPHGLLQPIEALAVTAPEVDAEGPVFELEPAAAQAQHGAAVADVIDSRRELRGQARVAERVRGDEQADLRAGGCCRECGERRPALELAVGRVALVAHQVVVDPEAVGAAPLSRDDGVPKARPVRPLDPERGPDSDRMG